MTTVPENVPAVSDVETAESQSVESIVSAEAVKMLSTGLLSMYEPTLTQVRKELSELTTKQEGLIDRMRIENQKLLEVQEDAELKELFSTIQACQGKLVNVKKGMISIHERTAKLKKRVMRLRQAKEKEALIRQQQREQEIRREQELIGKSHD